MTLSKQMLRHLPARVYGREKTSPCQHFARGKIDRALNTAKHERPPLLAGLAPRLALGIGMPGFVQRNVALGGIALGVCVGDSVGGMPRLAVAIPASAWAGAIVVVAGSQAGLPLAFLIEFPLLVPTGHQPNDANHQQRKNEPAHVVAPWLFSDSNAGLSLHDWLTDERSHAAQSLLVSFETARTRQPGSTARSSNT